MRVVDARTKGGPLGQIPAGPRVGHASSEARPSSGGGAYSFRGGACEALNTRHRGLRRGGAYRRGLEWPELAQLPGARSVAARLLTSPGWRPHGN